MGVVLYEMIGGRKPYSAETPIAILLKQASEPLPRLNQFVSDLPEAVENILIKSLAKDPQDRYENMAGFVQALHVLQVGRLPSTTSILQTSPDAPTLIPTLINEAPQESAAAKIAVAIPAPIPYKEKAKQKSAVKAPSKSLLYIIAGAMVILVLAFLAINLINKPAKPVVAVPSNTPTNTPLPASTLIPSAIPSVVFTVAIPTKTTVPPTAQPTPIPFEPSQWRGTFRWFGSLNPVNFIIQEVNGPSFTGAMYWQFTQCKVTQRVEGDIIQDITTATEQNRWALHPDFQSGDKSGLWLRWTQNKDISGSICSLTISGDWWYAHINSDGHMVGIHFTNSTNTEPDTGATFDFTLVSP